MLSLIERTQSGPPASPPRGGPGLLALLLALSLSACQPGAEDHMEAARDALFEKDPQRALRRYRQALDLLQRDGSAEARVIKARALRGAADVYFLELRDVEQAKAVYRELVESCPEAPESLEARIILADILRMHYRDPRGAINELTAALARNPPQSAELNYQVAKLYFELGDYQQSIIEAERLMARYETSPFVDDAMLLKAQALTMAEATRPDARRAFEALVRQFPESELTPHALFELGKVKADAGENEKAIELWVKALERHPDPAMVQSAIGRVRRRIVATTPTGVGSRAEALARHPPPPLP